MRHSTSTSNTAGSSGAAEMSTVCHIAAGGVDASRSAVTQSQKASEAGDVLGPPNAGVPRPTVHHASPDGPRVRGAQKEVVQSASHAASGAWQCTARRSGSGVPIGGRGGEGGEGGGDDGGG